MKTGCGIFSVEEGGRWWYPELVLMEWPPGCPDGQMDRGQQQGGGPEEVEVLARQ